MNDSGIRVLNCDDSMEGFASLTPNVEYSEKSGQKLALLLPWGAGRNGRKYPLIVFVQGSAWTHPNINTEIPQLSELARGGIAVATIEHRNCLDGNPFPACLEDTKTAIRFLRANSEKYGLDPDRVGIFGTSSGGNIALLTGITADDPAYRNGEYDDCSDAVKLVVDCFGPSDLYRLMGEAVNPSPEAMALYMGLKGDREQNELFAEMSPLYRVEDGKEYPAFMLLQGDNDPVVDYSQTERMYLRLREAGVKAEMVRVNGGVHEGNFWSRVLLEAIFAFIRENIG